MSKKSTPFKAASAVIAGLLVLGSGIAVAGADSDDPTHQPVEVVSDPADPALVAESGTDGEDGAADETAPDGSEDGDVRPDPVEDGDDAVEGKPVDDDPADDDRDDIEITDDDGIVTISDGADQADDQGEVKAHPVHPANHGAQVSQAAHQKEVLAGSDARNHGAAVSAVARSKSHAAGDDDDKVKVDDEDAAKKAKKADGDDQDDDQDDSDDDEDDSDDDEDDDD